MENPKCDSSNLQLCSFIVYSYFFSFSEEKKYQKEKLFRVSWEFRPLRRPPRDSVPSNPASF